jgi:hypothetical protein
MDDDECSGSKLDSTDVGREMDDLRVGWISHGRFLSSHEVTGKRSSVHERDVVAGRSCRWVGSFWHIPNSLQVHFVGPFHLI